MSSRDREGGHPVTTGNMSIVLPKGDPSDMFNSNLLPVGTRLGEFEITGLVGEGGFGIVYLALDTSLDRTVAIKEYMPAAIAGRAGAMNVVVKSERQSETFTAGLRGFVNEAKLLAQFDHPALVKVFRFWEANGTAYMVMPFYQGKTLRQALRDLGAPPDEAWLLKTFLPLLDALELIHSQQCYHRDIAPDNVLVLPDGQPLLLDFGAARRVIGDMTQALTVILKPGYAPIEQYAEIPGMRQGPWTDLYALAAVGYFAIMGKVPPPSVARMMSDTMPLLSNVAAGRYSQELLAAMDACLRVRPEDRPRNIGELRQQLEQAVRWLRKNAPGEIRGLRRGNDFLGDPHGEAGEGPSNDAADDFSNGPAHGGNAPHDPVGDDATVVIGRGARPVWPPQDRTNGGSSGPIPDPRSLGPGGRMPVQPPIDSSWTPIKDVRPDDPRQDPRQQREKKQPKLQEDRRKWQVRITPVTMSAALAAAVVLGVGAWLLIRPATVDTGKTVPPVAKNEVPVRPTGPVASRDPPQDAVQDPVAKDAPKDTLKDTPKAVTTAPTPPSPRAPLEPGGILDEIMQGRDPAWPVSVQTLANKVTIGKDKLQFRIVSERAGFLYIFMIGTDTQHVYQLFPNALDSGNRVGANRTLELPRPGWAMVAGGPPGMNRFVAIVSEAPRDFSKAGLRKGDPFSEFDLVSARAVYAVGGRGALLGKPACKPDNPTRCEGYGAARFEIEESDAPR